MITALQRAIFREFDCFAIPGFIFAPYQKIENPVTIFSRQICRKLLLKYKKSGSLRGIPTAVFTETFDYVGDKNETRCFCRRPDKCPKVGTIDLLPCVQAPVTVSLPHFLHADPSLLAMIGSGLQPDEKKHEFFLNMELVSFMSAHKTIYLEENLHFAVYFHCCRNSLKISSAPLIGAGRIQINFELEPVKEIFVMANMPKMMFPIVWLEESAQVPDSLLNLIKYTIHLCVLTIVIFLYSYHNIDSIDDTSRTIHKS